MRKLNRHGVGLLLAVLMLSLAGCVTATPYQTRDRGYGYSEQKLEANRFRVTFSGNTATPREVVENYLLYRAAELTLQQGYDFFVMAQKDTDTDVRYQQSVSAFPNVGGYYYWYPAFSVGVTSTQSQKQYAAQADIVMFRGEKTSEDTRAFNAKDLKNNLEPLIVRSPG